MNSIKHPRRKTVHFVLLPSFIFSLTFFLLAITPNYAYGCGEIQNGTKLTYLINRISKNITGKPVFKK